MNVEDVSAESDGRGDKGPPTSHGNPESRPHGRNRLPAHLKRERIVHDLTEAEKHCAICAQDLREFGEETSERYEYIPVQLIVIEEVCKKYACDCTVKTARKPAQPIEKSIAGAGLMSQVIVSKYAFAAEPAGEDLSALRRRTERSALSAAEGFRAVLERGGDRRREMSKYLSKD